MVATRTIQHQYFIQAPSSRVFRAITEPEQLKRWFLATAKLVKKKGETYEFTWQGGYKASGRVLDYAPGKKLSLSWPQFWNKKYLGDTRATFTAKSQGNGTLLKLRHSGYKNGYGWIENYALTHSGWAYFLTNLKSVMEHGYDLRSNLDRPGI